MNESYTGENPCAIGAEDEQITQPNILQITSGTDFIGNSTCTLEIKYSNGTIGSNSTINIRVLPARFNISYNRIDSTSQTQFKNELGYRNIFQIKSDDITKQVCIDFSKEGYGNNEYCRGYSVAENNLIKNI
jgi:hypothetical protein